MTLRYATTAPKIRFAATLDEEPEVEVALGYRSGARAFLTDLCAKGFSEVLVRQIPTGSILVA